MLSGSRVGTVVAVVLWQQKNIISRSIYLRSSPSLSRPPSLSASRSFNPSCLQRRTGSSGKKHSVNNLLVISIPNFSTRLTTSGASYYRAPPAPSSPLWSPSVILRRSGIGQQQRQRRNRRNSSNSQQQNTISIGGVASTDDPEADLNQKNSLHEELERHGVHESDYKPQSIIEYQLGSGSSSMPSKQKATADFTNGRKQQRTPPKGKSDVVQDWCCYLLLSVDSKKTYVGVTFDISRRLRQHNGEISGGAKSARVGRPWRVVCTVHGFNSRSEACQFEWRWKANAAKYKIFVRRESETVESPLVTRRRATLAKVLKVREEWNCLNVQWHAD